MKVTWAWLRVRRMCCELHVIWTFFFSKSVRVPAVEANWLLSSTGKFYKESRYIFKPTENLASLAWLNSEMKPQYESWKASAHLLQLQVWLAFISPRSVLIQLLLLPYRDPWVQRHPWVILRLFSLLFFFFQITFNIFPDLCPNINLVIDKQGSNMWGAPYI